MMEQIADRGNGNYHYVDSERQAERVFGRDFTKMIQDVAQDVKIQVEFDQRAVRAYRLAGYENRAIADRDFRNDRVDAGEIGAGHQVTALYEVDLRPDARGTLATVRVRAKEPRGVEAKETERAVTVAQVQRPLTRAPADLKLAAAAMGGAELLRNSPHAGSWSYDRVISLLEDGADPRDPDRGELLALMRIARDLNGSESARISRR
jgi:Ca-activated chloride channel family protein